jgi:chemotaxis protein methyltransferase CheR
MNTSDKEVCLDYIVRYVCKIVSKKSGNLLEEAQHSMVASRLKKRIIDLSLGTHQAYFEYIKSNMEEESKHLISLLTTHHTFFFREFYHFEYLIENIQEIIDNVRSRGESKIKIYSAACSRGQEAYSLAMFFNVILKKIDSTIDFEIIGTDIDEECITHAKNGVYNYVEIKKIPDQFLTGHFERGKGELSNFVRVKKEIKDKCSFYPANIFDQNHVRGKFDIIFCRNVFIYFKQDEIHQVVDIFRRHLFPSGFFVTGLCESLKPLDLKNLYHRGICIYAFDEERVKVSAHSISSSSAPEIIRKSIVPTKVNIDVIPKPIRLMIVDDSKSIQKLLSRIFDKDPDFDVVAIANDGVHAEELMKSHTIDAMTLDIHMPNKSGVEYLKDNHNSAHPKVVIVSSANREDSEFSSKAIEYGASDFVEKPALNNINQKAQEIKNKLKMSFFNASNTKTQIHKSFQSKLTISNPQDKVRVLFCSKSSEFKLEHFIKEMGTSEPACIVLYEGNNNLLESFAKRLSSQLNKDIKVYGDKLEVNGIYLADAESFFDNQLDKVNRLKVSVGVFGNCSEFIESKITDFKNAQLLLEDVEEIKNDLYDIASDIFPYTSFYFVSSRFLGDK